MKYLILLFSLMACTPGTVFAAAFCSCQVTVLTEDERNGISLTPKEALNKGLAYCYAQADKGCPEVKTKHRHLAPYEVRNVKEGAVPIHTEKGTIVVEFIYFHLVAPAETIIEHQL